MIVEVISHAPVAQLDRARASDARCRKFESCQVHFSYAKFSRQAAGAAIMVQEVFHGTDKMERITYEI